MDFEIRRRRPFSRLRPLYGRDVYFIDTTSMFHKCGLKFGSGNSSDVLRTVADVHFMKVYVYFNIKSERQSAVDLHSDVRKNPRLYSVIAYSTSTK